MEIYRVNGRIVEMFIRRRNERQSRKCFPRLPDRMEPLRERLGPSSERRVWVLTSAVQELNYLTGKPTVLA